MGTLVSELQKKFRLPLAKMTLDIFHDRSKDRIACQ
jgi:hypothetical protein